MVTPLEQKLKDDQVRAMFLRENRPIILECVQSFGEEWTKLHFSLTPYALRQLISPEIEPTESLFDPLAIPTKKVLKGMRIRAEEQVAHMLDRKGIDIPIPKLKEPASVKETDKPHTKKWRGYWQFPGGMGLNIPNNMKSKCRLKRKTARVLERQEAYLKSLESK